jgi:hypothetical protein
VEDVSVAVRPEPVVPDDEVAEFARNGLALALADLPYNPAVAPV